MDNSKSFLWSGYAIIIFIMLSSCRSQKDIKYFQVKEDTVAQSRINWKNFPKNDTLLLKTYAPVIHPNDILKIYVSSINREASSFFNPVVSSEANSTAPEILGYLVDANGEIELPLVGKVMVDGLTVSAIRDLLKQKLAKYLESPTVRIIFENYKITILGEVVSPGSYSVQNERITIPEAIGMAGDLTIYGKRNNILLVREENKKREFAVIDLTNRNLFESPYYFLHPNDILYVEPVKARTSAGDNFYRIFPIILSSFTLISIFLLRIKL